MIKLDAALLDELGLSALGAEDKKALLSQIYKSLQLRVGTALSNKMNQSQLAEFDQLIAEVGGVPDPNNPGAARAMMWLKSNIPDYMQIVNGELEKLKAEIKRDAPKILEASSSSPE